MPLSDIERVTGLDPIWIKTFFDRKGGLKTKVVSTKGLICSILSEEERKDVRYENVLYVYDNDALRSLLSKNVKLLRECGWPEDPDAFVDKVATYQVPVNNPLYGLIAEAFADKLYTAAVPKRT
jgi:hypothetical protein